MSEILASGALKFSEPDTPTRVGETINTISEIYDIPYPRVGMRVYVKDIAESYVVKSLKSKVIAGVVVPNAMVDEYEKFNNSTPTITWQGQNLNDYTTAGVYNIQGNRVSGDNMPILNEGVISARLTVLSTDDGAGNIVVTQVLSLNNNSGGEGNVYIRSCQKGTWKPWGKLQTNIEVGQVNTLDNLTDNGMYSGVLITDTGFDTFVLVVINNYAAAVPAGFGWYVSQLKYSLGLDGSVTVKTRRMDYTNTWSEWEELKGGATGGGPYTAIIPKDAKISSYNDGDVFFCLGSNSCELEGKTFTFPAMLMGRSSIVTRLNGSWHLRAFNTSMDTAYEEYILADRNRGWEKINGAVGGSPYTDTVEGGIITSDVIGETFLCLGTENSFRFVSSGTEYPIPTNYGILTILGKSSAHLRGFASTKDLYKEYIIPEEGTHIDSWQEIFDNKAIIYDTVKSDNYSNWSLGSFVPGLNSRCIIFGYYYNNGTPPVKLISGTCWCFLENKEDRILDITFTDDKGTNLNISTHLIEGMNNVDLRGASISGRIDYDCQFNVPLIFDNVTIGTGASVAIYKKDSTVSLIDTGDGCNLRSIGLDVTQNTLIKEYIENGEVKQQIID